jgi:hypothetical protein
MEKMTKLVHDVATGEMTIVELTEEEIAEYESLIASTPPVPDSE